MFCQDLEFLLELGLPCAEVMEARFLIILFEEVGIEGAGGADAGIVKESGVSFGGG